MNAYFIEFISKSNKFMSEMLALWDFWLNNKECVQILPTMYSVPNIPEVIYENYDDYNSIFDAASLGIYLGGMDPHHTNGKIVKGLKWWHSLIDYTQYKYKWELDNLNRNIPYIFNIQTNNWIKINNLHIHSKMLTDCLSKQIF
jgi:hypothetical protein